MKKGKGLSKWEIGNIRRMRKQGISVRNIAGYVGISSQAVSYHLYPKYRYECNECKHVWK